MISFVRECTASPEPASYSSSKRDINQTLIVLGQDLKLTRDENTMGHRYLPWVAILFSMGCEVVGGNPYDEKATPRAQLAPAQLRGAIEIAGCQQSVDVDLVLLEEAEVVYQAQTFISEDGKSAFVFTDVLPGGYQLGIRREGISTSPIRDVTLAAGESVELGILSVSALKTEVEGRVELSDLSSSDGVGVVLTGRSSACGEAIELTRFAAVQNGAYTITDVPAGTYALRAAKTGYTIDRTSDFSVQGNEEGRIENTVLEQVLTLHPTSSVLRVVDDIGAPLLYTNENRVNLEVLAFGGLTEMRYSTDETLFEDADWGWETYRATVSDVAIGDTDGPIVIWVQLRDGALVTDVYSTQVHLDRAPPVIRELTIDGGAEYLSENQGFVRLEAEDAISGIVGYQLSLNELDESFVPVSSIDGVLERFWLDETISFQNEGVFSDGAFLLSARVVDAAGNLSETMTAPITRDNTPPDECSSLTVTGGSPSSDPLPAFRWQRSGADEHAHAILELSSSESFSTLGQQLVAGTEDSVQISFPLTDGTWFWRVRLIDDAGNESTSVASAPLEIDTTPPLDVVEIPLASPATAPLVVEWMAPDDPDRAGVRVQLARDVGFASLVHEVIVSGESIDLTSFLEDGMQYFVRMAAVDDVGNRSSTVTSSFVFDSAAPALGEPAILLLSTNGRPLVEGALLDGVDVLIRLAAGSSGEKVFARISNADDCSDASVVELVNPGTSNNTVPWSLASGVTDKRAYVQFEDAAGNRTDCVSSQGLQATGKLSGNVTIDAGDSGIDVSLDAAANIRIVLVDENENPIGRTLTNAEGEWTINMIPVADNDDRELSVRGSKDGFEATSERSAQLVADENVDVGTLAFEVSTASVSGVVSVRMNTTGSPSCGADPVSATGASVTVQGTAFSGEVVSRSVFVDANGSYLVSGLPVGDYQTAVEMSGYEADNRPGRLKLVSPLVDFTDHNFSLTDTIAPSKPLLRAVDEVTSSEKTTLYVDLESADGSLPVSNFDGYRIERLTTPLGTTDGVRQFEYLNTVTQTAFEVDLLDGYRNRFIITPVDCAGNQGESDELVVIRDSSAPPTVENIRVDNRSNRVKIEWAPSEPPDTVAYLVHYGSRDSDRKAEFQGDFAAQGRSPILVSSNRQSSLMLTGLENETSFYVAVTAVDAAGNESELSERQAARPSEFPVDERVEVRALADTCHDTDDINDNLVADLNVTDRWVSVTTGLPGAGLQVYQAKTRDHLELISTLPDETDARHVVFDDYLVTYADEDVGSVHAYDMRDPVNPVLVGSGSNVFGSCSGCIFREISTVGFAPYDGGPVQYAATYRFPGSTERLATWERNPNQPGGFTWSGAFLSLETNEAARGLVQAGELIFVLHSRKVALYRVTPSGGLEFLEEKTVSDGLIPKRAQAVFDFPYLHIPASDRIVSFLVDFGDRSAATGLSGAGFEQIQTAPTRLPNSVQSLAFAGSRLLAFGGSGQDQRVLETFDQSGFSLAETDVAARTGLRSLGSVVLAPENALSQLHVRAAATSGNTAWALLHWKGLGQDDSTCKYYRALHLRSFELGSPSALSAGERIPRLGTSTGSTRWVDLQGGILTTTESSGSQMRVKTYDVRDPDRVVLVDESAGLDGFSSSIFYNQGNFSGATAAWGPYRFIALGTGAAGTWQRTLAVVDASVADDLRVIHPGLSLEPDSEKPENVARMEVRNGVLTLAQTTALNEGTTPVYLKTIEMDNPGSPGSVNPVANGTTGIAARGMVVDGAYAYVGGYDANQRSVICIVDISDASSPLENECIPVTTPAGQDADRVFTLARTPGHLLAGTDRGFLGWQISAPGVVQPAADFSYIPPTGLSLVLSTAQTFVYAPIGASSQLPLGQMLGFDVGSVDNETSILEPAGSLLDCEPGSFATSMQTAGAQVIVPLRESAYTAFMIALQ